MKKQLLALSVAAAISSQAQAFQFDTGDDWEIRWDNTLKGNLMARTEASDKEVYTPKCAHNGCGWWLADDATLSVDRSSLGIVSTRFDILSEMDVIYQGNFGFRISAAGWYDPNYSDSDHPRDRRGTWGQPTVRPGQYTDTAEEYHYFGGEVLDAFVFGNFDVGETAWGVRAGRHTIYWGNSLLAVGAINGFGGSMSPIDFNKALSVPGSEAKELFMPTAKISTVGQLTDNLTFNFYYNFEHMRNRLPESGTFFSPITGLTEDSEFITFPPVSLATGEPIDPYSPTRLGYKGHKDKHDSGDWGINFQYYFDNWGLETSFIYMNYVDKNINGARAGADVQRFVGITPPESGKGWDDGAFAIGDAYWVFKNDIDLYGISLAKEMAGISFGLDVVYRQDAAVSVGLGQLLQQAYNVPDFLRDTVEGLGFSIIEGGREEFFAPDSDDFPGPTGDVWSVVVNGLGLLSDNGFWEGGSWILEATFAMMDDCNDNCHLIDPDIKEDQVVTNIAGVFRPVWYQVYPGWDLTLPMSFNYTMGAEQAQSPFTFGGNEEGGSASFGAELLIDQAWTVKASYNIRFGPVLAGIGGLLKDRDNVALTVKRTF